MFHRITLPPKCPPTSNRLHSIISQKTELFTTNPAGKQYKNILKITEDTLKLDNGHTSPNVTGVIRL
jgi:hypothetical protein